MLRDHYTPEQFHAAFIETWRRHWDSDEEDWAFIRAMAERVKDERAEAAAEHIVSRVLSGKRASHEAVKIWLRGGAVFWRKEHHALGTGWPLSWLFDEEDALPRHDTEGALLKLRENWDFFIPFSYTTFGKIPIRASDGREVLAITQCGWVGTDQLSRIVRSEKAFMRLVRLSGMLWADDYENGDPACASDEVLRHHLALAERLANK